MLGKSWACAPLTKEQLKGRACCQLQPPCRARIRRTDAAVHASQAVDAGDQVDGVQHCETRCDEDQELLGIQVRSSCQRDPSAILLQTPNKIRAPSRKQLAAARPKGNRSITSFVAYAFIWRSSFDCTGGASDEGGATASAWAELGRAAGVKPCACQRDFAFTKIFQVLHGSAIL